MSDLGHDHASAPLCTRAATRQSDTMSRRSRGTARLTSIAIVLASMCAASAAFAQYPYGQSPGQYSPYPQQAPQQQPGQYNPYGAPQPGPYAQPLPYGTQQQQPNGYVPLGGNNQDMTSDDAHSWPILRLSGGAGFTFGPSKRTYTSAIIDATAGFRWAFHRRVSLSFEAGYSWDSEPVRGGNYGVIGAGPELYISRFLQIGWDPKFVIGGAWSGFAIGVRNTLIVPLFMHAVNVEIGHQFTHVGTDDRHELRAQIGVDVAGIAQLMITRKLVR